MIAEQLLQIKRTIQLYAPDPGKVKLIAVSKKQTIDKMQVCLDSGQTVFGENFLQEAQSKKELLQQGAEFHFIGRLQKNKIKRIPSLFSTLHTLTDYETAQLLNQHFAKSQQVLQVLLQVNLSQETSKAGLLDFSSLQYVTEQVLTLPNLKLIGLMTIGDPQATATSTQKLFAQLRSYQEQLAKQFAIEDQFIELSMGMSHDYILALQEGATFIRLGQSLFGSRK